jgi:hypothetical protein
MSRCCAKQAACCHGAAILDKRQPSAYSAKACPRLDPRVDAGFAIRIREGVERAASNFGKGMES